MVLLTALYTTALICPPDTACFDGGTILDSDIYRYKHGCAHGGVYHDDDASFRVSPHLWPRVYPHLPWRAASLVVGVEFPRPVGIGAPGCCLQFVQWAFASQPNSSLLCDAAALAAQRAAENHDPRNALGLTGPVMFTEVILRHIGNQFNLSDVENAGASYTTKGDTMIVLPYRAFGVHRAHRGPHINFLPANEQLVRHGFKGRWRS